MPPFPHAVCCGLRRPSGPISRRAVLAGGLAAAATVPFIGSLSGRAGGATGDYGFPPPDASGVFVRPIAFPVEGEVTWTDTYLAPRGSGRRHEGQDLMAPKMRRVLACIDATVVELRHGGGGGNSLYLEDDEGWYYAYLHINNDSPGSDDGSNRLEDAFVAGLATGDRVRKGQHVAYVGDSGNAEGSGSHLHFEIRRPAENWYSSQAVNAKPSLDNAGSTEPEVQSRVASDTFRPFDDAESFVRQQYLDILDEEASSGDVADFVPDLEAGRMAPASVVVLLMRLGDLDRTGGAVVRLYDAYFGRRPDTRGYTNWLNELRGGRAMAAEVSDAFARSSEFEATYGSLSDEAFVDLVYQNVLGRDPDGNGRRHWLDKLGDGFPRGGVMYHFSESTENIARTRAATDVCLTYFAMLRRAPDPNGFNHWSGHLSGEGQIDDLINSLRNSPEYASRF